MHFLSETHLDPEAVAENRPDRNVSPPVETEVIRHALISAAEEMKIALCRTAFSPLIYEVLDFACALYDREVRLLAQAKSLPIFLGTLNFCVDAAVRAVGGEENLEPGDIILTTYGFDIGSHPQDAVLVMPAFFEDELVGYSTIKAHWTDIAAKDPYCTDTIDNFQEGTIYPGIKLFRRGVRNEDVYRIIIANSRYPRELDGDITAHAVGVRTGTIALARVIAKHGLEAFRGSVEAILDHGEATVRALFADLPDGRYVGRGAMDSNGVTDELIPFEVAVEVAGSDVVIDYSNAPPEQAGPVNCPLPGTVSASRVAITALAGVHDSPTEGHFRPIQVRTTPGTLFDPRPPAPIYLYGWPLVQAIEAIHRALADALPTHIAAGSGGDICGFTFWGARADGELWYYSAPHVIGQGASSGGDGANALQHIGASATRATPVEVWEARNPWLVERLELAPDSGGPGRFRGGLGIDLHVRILRDCYLTSVFERTKTPSWGLFGGQSGRANELVVQYPDGSERTFGKATRLEIPEGSLVQFHMGGGGGYGPPEERAPEDVLADVREGYVTEGEARRQYPHAFPSERG
jgi:N-methylhydantoinase B